MKLYLSAAWQVIGSGSDGVMLSSESTATFLAGPQAAGFVKLLVTTGVDPGERDYIARNFIMQLKDAGAIRSSIPERDRSADGFYEVATSEIADSRLPLQVSIRHLFPRVSQVIDSFMECHGVHVSDEAPMLLVVTDDYLRPEIVNVARSENRPWLLARPVGTEILLGPLFQGREPPCFFCLAHRLRTQRWIQAALSGWDEEDCAPQPASVFLPGTLAMAAGWLATAVYLWCANGKDRELAGAVLSFNTLNFGTSRATVIPRETCAHCGGLSKAIHPKVDIMHWANHLTGIVSTLHTIQKPQGGYFHAGANFVQPLPLPRVRPLVKPGNAFGHGHTQSDAELCCMAEVIERASAVFRGDESRVMALSQEVNAITPDSILLFSDFQYRNRESWNSTHADIHNVPMPFNPKAPIEWTAVRSLKNGAIHHVPTALCYFWYPSDPRHTFASADSNGIAAGPTPLEAQLNATLELIERDAVALWWYNRIARPCIDLSDLHSRHVRAALQNFERQGFTTVVLDITTDLKIPVYAAIATRATDAKAFFGFGAHPDGPTAAGKAIREMEQSYFWFNYSGPSLAFGQWLAAVTLAEEYLHAHGSIAVSPCVNSNKMDLMTVCLQSLSSVGLEAFALDITRLEFDLPVWRVLIPGLRHCWMRFAPGRLYDIPVRLGWISDPPAEDTLNPCGCPL